MLPDIDQGATEAEDCWETGDESTLRLEDLRHRFGQVVATVGAFCLLGYIAYQGPGTSTTIESVLVYLGLVGFMAYMSLGYLDFLLCTLTSRHECRDCKRETARWTPEEDHRTLYERTTDEVASVARNLAGVRSRGPNDDRPEEGVSD